MRCDLHVHTKHSGMCTVPLLRRICRESYNDPDAVYEILKRRGMDLVTVTDHDSIDAAERLRRHADFFLSEEVTCVSPSGTELHVGVYGIDDRDHVELQRRRRDVPALASYVRERKLLASVNHAFSSLTGRRASLDFQLFEEEFAAMETLNGHMPAANNQSADRLARQWLKVPVAGSDAHTLDPLGRTFTDVPSARTIPDFLEGLRRGHGLPQGDCGNYFRLTATVLGIGSEMVRERLWPILFTPLFLVVPVITLANYAGEFLFEQKWSRQMWPGGFPLVSLEEQTAE